MIQATTPTLTLTLPETIDLSTAQEVLVTFQQYETTLTKTLNDNVFLTSANVISVYLSQEETLMFIPNKIVNVQVNWIENSGARAATSIGQISMTSNLIPKVINA